MLVVRQGLWGERQPADPPTRTTQPRDRGNDKRTHWRPEKGGGLGFRIALTRHSSIVASLRSPRRAHHHSVVYRSAGHIHGWTVSALYLDRWYPTRSRNNIGSHPTLIGAAYTRGGCVGLREVNPEAGPAAGRRWRPGYPSPVATDLSAGRGGAAGGVWGGG